MQLHVNIVLEILGRPPEHVTSALKEMIDKLNKEKEMKVLNSNIHEPKSVPESDLFTAFAEIELELKSISNYFDVLFGYLPSHIEIIQPENLSMSNFDFNELGNKLTHRLHEYDALAKRLIVERDMAIKKLQEVAPELFPEDTKPEETLERLTTGKEKRAKKRVKKKKKEMKNGKNKK